jgi:tetratricopeptide (TPR) repeat protein
LYLLSRAHHWNGDYVAAEVVARRAVQSDRSNEFAWSTLVLALWKQGRFTAAEAEFQRAIEIAPENFGAWMNHAEGLYAAGRVREAADAYEQICAIYALDPTAWINRARVLKCLGKPRRAFECLERIAECYYSDAVPLADLACEYLASDEPDLRDTQAGIDMAALAQVPAYSAPWAAAIVALAEYRAGKWQTALSRTSRIDRDDSAGAWASLVAAAAFQELQQPQEALTSFKRAERLLTGAPVDDARLATFYEEVADLLGEVAKPLSTTRPTLYEQPF